MEKKEAVIVIPAYKKELTATEEISLQQVYRILGAYDICFMAPEKLRTVLEKKGLQGEYFPDACFGSVVAYSRLLLDMEFYKRFSDYEYMLLYQMDAFVFSDRLHEFCQMGYDYIGAPVHRMYGWPYNLSTVGNGGFSLRKISSCIEVLKRKDKIYSKLSREKIKILEDAEDRFFTYCGIQNDIFFRLPPFRVALDFAIEHQIRKKILKMNITDLPFGCHAWSKPYFYQYWRKYIEASGYALEEADIQWNGKCNIDYFKYLISPYLMKRLLRQNNDEACKIVKVHLPVYSGAILWGRGKIGDKAIKFFAKMGWRINVILDKFATEGEVVDDIAVRMPSKRFLLSRSNLIVICTSKYRNEIAKELMDLGLDYGKDFIYYSAEVEEKAAIIYFEKCCSKWFRGGNHEL